MASLTSPRVWTVSRTELQKIESEEIIIFIDNSLKKCTYRKSRGVRLYARKMRIKLFRCENGWGIKPTSSKPEIS